MLTHCAWCAKQKLAKPVSVVTSLVTLFVLTHVGLGRQDTRSVVLIQKRIDDVCGGTAPEGTEPL